MLFHPWNPDIVYTFKTTSYQIEKKLWVWYRDFVSTLESWCCFNFSKTTTFQGCLNVETWHFFNVDPMSFCWLGHMEVTFLKPVIEPEIRGVHNLYEDRYIMEVNYQQSVYSGLRLWVWHISECDPYAKIYGRLNILPLSHHKHESDTKHPMYVKWAFIFHILHVHNSVTWWDPHPHPHYHQISCSSR